MLLRITVSTLWVLEISGVHRWRCPGRTDILKTFAPTIIHKKGINPSFKKPIIICAPHEELFGIEQALWQYPPVFAVAPFH